MTALQILKTYKARLKEIGATSYNSYGQRGIPVVHMRPS